VGDLNDRRARKKAQTREAVRAVAQRLFAEHGFDAVTISDVAREADVAVQTVFNHFATKEDLFFDGRTPWVDGPAQAVRSRPAGVAPLTALRGYIVDLVGTRIGSLGDRERRAFIDTIEASDALCSKERELVLTCERALSEALLEAWDGEAPRIVDDPRTVARLIAAIWTATARVLIIDHRPQVTAGADPASTADGLRCLGERMFRQLELTMSALESVPAHDPQPDTGWPQVTLRAG
jgi:AcrR family transcriptional regulator